MSSRLVLSPQLGTVALTIYITLILLRFLKAPRQFCLNRRRTALIQLAKGIFEKFENVDEGSELATANEES